MRIPMRDSISPGRFILKTKTLKSFVARQRIVQIRGRNRSRSFSSWSPKSS